ncbi:MAG: TonB-dependent receptor plug domain-containing protein [Gammaproteobacteria bacterium]
MRDHDQDEVIVTGSRLRRHATAAPAEVTTIDRKRIEQLGVTSVADVLAYLPQVSFSDSASLTFAGTRQVRLRGLGFGTTLVLINGRRTVTSALLGVSGGFDLSTLPLSAVERIEVVSDSASAVYGADAVGGVVNIILKGSAESPVLDLYYGSASGGADERRASITAGSAGDGGERFRGLVSLDYFDRGLLMGSERERWADQDYRRFGGQDRRFPFTNPGNITSASGGNLPGLPSPVAAVPEGSSGVGLTPADFLSTAGQVRLDSYFRDFGAVNESEQKSAMASAEFDASERLTVFGEFLYTTREGRGLIGPSFLADEFVPATNPFNPFGEDVSASFLLTGIESQTSIVETESSRAVLGLRGELSSWEWELSAIGTKDDATDFDLNVIDFARVGDALAATDPSQALNVFQDGPGGSAELLRSLVAPPVVDDYSGKSIQSGAFVRGPLFELPSGAAQAVVGVEWRKEEIDLGLPTFGLSIVPDRRSSAAYAEFRLPLLGAPDAALFPDRLVLTLAGRYDDYSDFGSTFNPQYGLEWQPVSFLLLRSAYGTSFRPPLLFNLHQPAQRRTTLIRDDRRGGQLTQYTAVTGGNPNLDAEESDTFTLGAVLAPTGRDGLRFSASYWRIHQDQRVRNLNPGQILANEATLGARVVRAPPTAADIAAGIPGRLLEIDTTNINFGSLDTSGVDGEVSLPFDTAYGRVTASVAATWVEEYRVTDLPSTPVVDRVGLASTQGTIPEWKGVATLTWELRGFDLAATTRLLSSYDDVNSRDIATGRRVGSLTLVDLSASVDVGESLAGRGSSLLEGLVIRAGVTNLFDEAPKFSEVRFAEGFDPSQGNLVQRFGYVSVSKAF